MQYASKENTVRKMHFGCFIPSLISFIPFRPKQIPLKTVRIQMKRLMMSRLIKIYTVCFDSRRAVVSFWRKNVHNTDKRLED